MKDSDFYYRGQPHWSLGASYRQGHECPHTVCLFVWKEKPQVKKAGILGRAREEQENEVALGTDLNFPVRTCNALIPHFWAPPTSPTMSSPIMTACQ